MKIRKFANESCKNEKDDAKRMSILTWTMCF
jgi:hypothetical protein